MKIAYYAGLESALSAPLLVLPFWEGGEEAAETGGLKARYAPLVKSGDFKGKNGEVAALYLDDSSRVLLLGLGKKGEVSLESIRRAYSAAVRFAQQKKLAKAHFLIPKGMPFEPREAHRALFEGISLTNYAFSKLKGDSQKDQQPVLLGEVGLIGLEASEAPFIDRLSAIHAAVFAARNLVNSNADDKIAQLTHEFLPGLKRESSQLQVQIFEKRKLEEEKMGLILAVARGSSVDPCLAQVSYRGNPQSKEHIVLVGKGITYDTGGLSIKPTDGMLTMKCDMAGAAAVLATMQAVASLGLKINVTALAPLAENCIGSKSYKLGDVYRSYSGRTVEINNTDAEGRLVLADALSYAVKNLNPTCIIDLATLTGAAIIALGDDVSALFTKDEALKKDLLHASDATGESAWHLPLVSDYKESYKSDIADTLNSGGRDAGAIKAALFLQEFVSNVSWAHLDIAGPAFINKPKYYNPTKATGFGVRLLVEFLEKRAAL